MPFIVGDLAEAGLLQECRHRLVISNAVRLIRLCRLERLRTPDAERLADQKPLCEDGPAALSDATPRPLGALDDQGVTHATPCCRPTTCTEPVEELSVTRHAAIGQVLMLPMPLTLDAAGPPIWLA
jgi:hypothetical protein